MAKTALILHGWPQTELNQHFLIKFLKKEGYDVLTPSLYFNLKDLNIKNSTNVIINGLEGKKPDLIIGISMGGLILPRVAVKYPNAKLIFIASGVHFKPNLLLANLGIMVFRVKLFRKVLIRIGDNIPIEILEKLYRIFNPYTGDKDREIYEEDLKLNLIEMKKHPFEKHLALLDLIENIDNREILPNIKNRSLIFNGKNDLLMPRKGGEHLRELLENSKFIVNEGGHFCVFNKKDLSTIKEFLIN
ncbi:MAG TPA: alpha/beta fold hydrolase [Patescibacteria group bacterium]|nr:alpha/beta fold hydrolase [Patescibacteria group bacterium]